MSKFLSSILDFSRWAAAFLVVIAHVRHLVLVQLNHVQAPSIFTKFVYFITGFGHESVIVFFIISGFLVGGITWERWVASEPNLKQYFAARIARIYTVLVPALLLGYALDSLGAHYLHGTGLYNNAEIYNTTSISDGIDKNINIPTLLGNLLMLQGIKFQRLGSNGPLWSLSWEWWYYCLFGLAAMIAIGRQRAKFVSALLFGALCYGLPTKLLLWGSYWILGLVIFVSGNKLRKTFKLRHFLLSAIVFLSAMAISRLSHNIDNVANPEAMLAEYGRDMIVALGYALFLLTAMRLPSGPFIPGVNARLAEFSYTVYLCHFPALVFLVALFASYFDQPFQIQPGLKGYAYAGSILLMLYAYSYVVYRCTEAHTMRTRKWLLSLLANAQTRLTQ